MWILKTLQPLEEILVRIFEDNSPIGYTVNMRVEAGKHVTRDETAPGTVSPFGQWAADDSISNHEWVRIVSSSSIFPIPTTLD